MDAEPTDRFQSGRVRVTLLEAGDRFGGRIAQGQLKGLAKSIDLGVCTFSSTRIYMTGRNYSRAGHNNHEHREEESCAR